MPFLGAVSAANKIKVHGDSTTPPVYNWQAYLSINPNTNVYTARVNQTSFPPPLAELTYDGGSGTLADVRPGMLVLISHTNDRTAAFFRGRVRKTPTSTVLYINQTGAAFADDDYIFVIDDYPIMAKWPQEVAQVLKVDWDIDYRALLPLIWDLKGAYVDFVDTGTSVITISFAPSVLATASGAAITTHLWDVEDGTITVGTTATQNITATFPAGFRWIHYTVTDDNGNAQIRHIPVWAHDTSSDAPTPLEFGGLSISVDIPTGLTEGASTGYNGSVAAFAQVSSILDNTLVVGWFVDTYNGAAGAIVDNVGIVGRFRNEANTTAYTDEGQRDDSVRFDIEGVMTQMENQRVPILEILDNASPTTFNEVETLTLWRALVLYLSEYSTFASLYSLEFDSTADTFAFIGFVTAGDNLLTSVSDLASRINAVFQQSPNGSCEIVRRGIMLDSAGRAALTTVLDLTTEDLLSIESYNRDYVSPVGSIFGDGGGYDTTLLTFSAYDVRAPGGAANSGARDGSLRRQLLEADQTAAEEKTELSARAGNALAAQQNIDTLAVRLLDGWRWLIPAVDQWYTWTLDGSETTRGIILTTATNWWLQAISITPQENIIEVIGTFLKESAGDPGEIIYWPVLETGAYPLTLGDFDIGDFNLTLPPPTQSIDLDTDFTVSDGGFTEEEGTYVAATGWQPDCVGGTSEYLDISGSLGGVKTVKSITVTYDAVPGPDVTNLNKIYIRVAGSFWDLKDEWTTQSGSGLPHITTLPNVPADSIRIVMYAGGSDCTGTLTLTDLSIVVEEQTEEWEHTFDFTSSDGGWAIIAQAACGADARAVYTPGTGWQSRNSQSGGGCGLDDRLYVEISFTSTTVTDVIITNSGPTAASPARLTLGTTSSGAELIDDNLGWTPGTHTWNGSQAMTLLSTTATMASAGTLTMPTIVVKGTGTNPFL